jgi:hypothetical protein
MSPIGPPMYFPTFSCIPSQIPTFTLQFRAPRWLDAPCMPPLVTEAYGGLQIQEINLFLTLSKAMSENMRKLLNVAFD